MRLFFLSALLFFVTSPVQAFVLEVGSDIEEVKGQMAAAKYAETLLAAGVTVFSKSSMKMWSVDAGTLIVHYSDVSHKVSDISFWFSDERVESERKATRFFVKRFDTTTGEMLIQTYTNRRERKSDKK